MLQVFLVILYLMVFALAVAFWWSIRQIGFLMRTMEDLSKLHKEWLETIAFYLKKGD